MLRLQDVSRDGKSMSEQRISPISDRRMCLSELRVLTVWSILVWLILMQAASGVLLWESRLTSDSASLFGRKLSQDI